MTLIDANRFPRLHLLSKEAAWEQEPNFSFHRDRMEEWLKYVHERRALELYHSDLLDDRRHRDDTFAEIAVAHFLEVTRGLSVAEWRPTGADGKQGDLLIDLPSADRIFVEVKRPSWRAEFAKAQGQESRRLLQPKYLEDETGAITYLWPQIRTIIRNAYPQFPNSMPTLFVLCDDLTLPLYTCPDWVEEILYRRATEGFTDWLGHDGPFASRECQRLGALATLNLNPWSQQPEYWIHLFPNPHADRAVALPDGLFGEDPKWDGAKWRLSDVNGGGGE